MGSEYAPTEQATRRERMRHLLEREQGHVAAGTGGVERASELTDVSRKSLSEAAQEADRKVAGHTIRDTASADREKQIERAWAELDEHPPQ